MDLSTVHTYTERGKTFHKELLIDELEINRHVWGGGVEMKRQVWGEKPETKRDARNEEIIRGRGPGNAKTAIGE